MRLAAKFDGDKRWCNLPRDAFSRVKPLGRIIYNAHSYTMQDNLYPYSVNKLIVGLGLNTNVSHREIFPNNTFNTITKRIYDRLPPTDETIADIKSALDYLPCEIINDWIRQAMQPKNFRAMGI